MGVDVIGGEALEVANGHGFIAQFLAVAVALTGMVADAAADGGQRAALAHEVVGFLELAGGDEGDVALGVDAGGAGAAARGRRGGLGDGEEIGDGLGVEAGDGLAGAQAAVEVAGQRDGAGLGTVAAGVAFFGIDEARLAGDLDGEIAGGTVDLLHVGERDDFDIFVAGAFDELGGEDAHGAIAGGESLVELGHFAADGGGGIDEVDLEAGLGEVQGGLDAGDAGADDHDRAESLSGRGAG